MPLRSKNMENSKKARKPSVSRVMPDMLVELVYDPDRRATALVVCRDGADWTIEQEVERQGEILVPYAPTNNLIENECVKLPSKPEDHGSRRELVTEIESFLHRYVDVSPLFEKIAAHYILLSWVYDAFNEVPYLRLQGRYGSGKTRGLLAIGSLAYKAFFASGASTTSPIFHTLDAFTGTLVLDEADFRFSDATSDLVKIFNNGTVEGLPVLRTIQNRQKEFNPQAFRVFGPKIVGMRGSFEDEALESRFITEFTGHSSLRSDIPIHLPTTFKAEALALRNKLLHFRLTERGKVVLDPAAMDQEKAPRLRQIAAPLLSLVDDLSLRAEIAAELASQYEAIPARRAQSIEARIAGILHQAFTETSRTCVPLREVAEKVNERYGDEVGESMTSKVVGGILRTRLDIKTSKRGGNYVVPHTEKKKVESLSNEFASGEQLST